MEVVFILSIDLEDDLRINYRETEDLFVARLEKYQKNYLSILSILQSSNTTFIEGIRSPREQPIVSTPFDLKSLEHKLFFYDYDTTKLLNYNLFKDTNTKIEKWLGVNSFSPSLPSQFISSNTQLLMVLDEHQYSVTQKVDGERAILVVDDTNNNILLNRAGRAVLEVITIYLYYVIYFMV